MRQICLRNLGKNAYLLRFFSTRILRKSQAWDSLLQIVTVCYTIFNRLCAKTHMISLLTPSTQVGVFFRVSDLGSWIWDSDNQAAKTPDSDRRSATSKQQFPVFHSQ